MTPARSADPARRSRRVVPQSPDDRAKVEKVLAQAAERAAIVRWLRREPNVWLNRAADAIERGAHVDGCECVGEAKCCEHFLAELDEGDPEHVCGDGCA